MLVSVWEENRGCERHDILSWPQILQNLTLRENFACRSPFKHEKPVSRMFTRCHPSFVQTANACCLNSTHISQSGVVVILLD